jgi:hypothetical protein
VFVIGSGFTNTGGSIGAGVLGGDTSIQRPSGKPAGGGPHPISTPAVKSPGVPGAPMPGICPG